MKKYIEYYIEVILFLKRYKAGFIMAGSTFGKKFKVMTWGESHGQALGVVIDGCPAGLMLNEDDIQKYLDLRKPGQNKYATQRNEDDKVEILSGIFQGKTTGTPISLIIYNKSQRSSDYSEIASYYRPGHADYTFDIKYGFRDYRGGGRSSGRETTARVAAGAIALKLLGLFGVEFTTYAKQIGPFEINMDNFDKSNISEDLLRMPDKETSLKAQEYLDKVRAEKDSVGGIIECRIDGVYPGLGDPVFDKLDARLAYAIMSIGAVKGIEFGEGFNVANLKGSENNDEFYINKDVSNKSFDLIKDVSKKTNHSGGVLGGMSDGSTIVFRCAIKPTPSIAKEQRTINKNGEDITVSIKGRHDPIIVPRAVVVVEAMAALTILDAMLENMGTTVQM